MVELKGIEPSTSCLQGRHSPSWVTAPKKIKSGSIRPTLRTAIRCCSNLYFRGESNLSNAWLPSSKQGSAAGDNLHEFFNVILIVLIALSPYFIYIQFYFCIYYNLANQYFNFLILLCMQFFNYNIIYNSVLFFCAFLRFFWSFAVCSFFMWISLLFFIIFFKHELWNVECLSDQFLVFFFDISRY